MDKQTADKIILEYIDKFYGFSLKKTCNIDKAEELAAAYGNDTVYNYVHPNNHGMITFLKSRGYTVLNLIEIRKPWKGEKLTQTIRVGEHEFDY